MKLLVDEEFIRLAPDLLERAKETVLVCQFVMALEGRPARGPGILMEKLWAKAREGVRVQVLLDGHGGTGGGRLRNLRAARFLEGHGVRVRQLARGRTSHAKYVVVDGAFALVGSHNWTVDSLRRNHEVSVLVEDREAVRRLAEEFSRLWACAVPFLTPPPKEGGEDEEARLECAFGPSARAGGSASPGAGGPGC